MEEFRTGWLSPSGELIHCDTYEHLEVAGKLCEKVALPTAATAPDEVLLNYGWVHISKSRLRITGNVYAVDWRRPLTPEQKRYLEPFFEDGRYPMTIGTQMHWKQEIGEAQA